MVTRLFLTFLLVVPTVTFADGYEPAPTKGVLDESSATGSSINDSRLPPVLPGEVVERGGKKMRVWSSSGAVSTEAVPEPPQPAQQTPQSHPSLDGLGVIVDQRDR